MTSTNTYPEQGMYSSGLSMSDRRAPGFVTTHWSAVAAAGETGTLGAAALEDLCRQYWYPLYVYVRRQGHPAEEAKDLTQSFFVRLLEKGYLANADPQRGKFRTFLLTALQRFLINEWNKQGARKRGGHAAFLSWDEEEAENRYVAEGAEPSDPQKLFEKRWALALLDQVLNRLKAELAEAGKIAQFEELKVLLWGEKSAPSYAEVAAKTGLTEGTLRVAVHRLRSRYRELLRAEVARTVSSPEEVDEELRHLLAVVSG